MPVTMSAAPFAAQSAPLHTGSIGPALDDLGVARRIGDDAWRELQPALARALDAAADDGDSHTWRSRDGGLSGALILVTSYLDEAGLVCRRIAVTVAESGAADALLMDACRGADHRWRVAPHAGDRA